MLLFQMYIIVILIMRDFTKVIYFLLKVNKLS